MMGVMAQTREHLAILQLTGQPTLTVALTGTDRVETARVEGLRRRSRRCWREFRLYWRDPVRRRGDGRSGYRRAARSSPAAFRARFTGSISVFAWRSTGVLLSKKVQGWWSPDGVIRQIDVGDTLWLTGVDKPIRVRGLHAQRDQPVAKAWAGQRIALNIVGDAQKRDLNRGDWLLSLRPPEASERVIVRLQFPRRQWQLAAYPPCRQSYYRPRVAARRRAGGAGSRYAAAAGG